MALNDDFNPEDFPAIPDELLANQEEQAMEYLGEEDVVDTTTKFLNIEGAEFGAQIFHALKEGNIEPMKTLLMIKKMKHVHDYFLGSTADRPNIEAKEYLKSKISNEVGKETYRAYGAAVSIETIGGATVMDYTECGDIYLTELYKIEKELKAKIKERQDFIKTNLPAESKTLGIRTLKVEIDVMPVLHLTVPTETKTINIVPPIKISREGIMVRFVKRKK